MCLLTTSHNNYRLDVDDAYLEFFIVFFSRCKIGHFFSSAYICLEKIIVLLQNFHQATKFPLNFRTDVVPPW